MASKILKAQYTIDDYHSAVMPSHELKHFVTSKLLHEMLPALENEMTIKNIGNPNTGISTYTGTLHVGTNGISTVSASNYHKDIPTTQFRVVEFTKNGKVTKVELQQHSEDGWRRIPRIQIEEK